jgi:hypothetical protein
MKISSLPSSPLFIHALLPLFVVLIAFGAGLQTITVFAILYYPLAVYYVRNTRWWWIFLFYMMNSIGVMLAYLQSFNLGTKMAKIYAGVIFGMGLVVNFAMLIPYIFDKIAQHRLSSDGWARIMVFPCIWTGISTISLYVNPLGDMVDYA